MTRVLHKTLQHTLLSVRDLLVTAGPLVLLTLVLLLLAYWVLDPTPPQRVVLATGTPRGAYAEFGQRYAKVLKRHGITVELRNTQGAAENLALLRNPDSGVDVAFVQGGADAEGSEQNPANKDLLSLGSLFHEPVWLFYRQDAAQRLLKSNALTSLAQLPGWRLNIGPPGSGVPNLMNRVLEANALKPETLTLLRQEETPAVVALLDGSLDALVFASAPESLMVQMLLRTPGIRLFDFAQAEAYARRFEFISPVLLPRGIVDLATDQPPQDVHLVAPTAMLVAREHTHPALIQLLVQAAQEVHGGAGWFQRRGEFPNIRNTEWPLAAEAERYYRNGPPWMQRYLPFWFANLFDRMWVVLVSIIAVLLPLSRIVPPLYQFRIRSRVFRWYAQLRAIEEGLGSRPAEELARELDEVEARVGQVSVPLSYADELYSLRGHIAMVRRRLAGPRA
ncbi:TAXI family TRAP transporter solute-binding subunit [Aquabacterium sp.]|uniref:TAXI family TRAP transporter solute-binding subunit n=1 Tax=Aquabacterium sp. TaxID=1872578 RepID=UPI002D801396|nr:TAXI family TRAP transporter solute-binding subunit [Aquabacterium sp.]